MMTALTRSLPLLAVRGDDGVLEMDEDGNLVPLTQNILTMHS